MKRYKITYWREDRSKPYSLNQISKSGRRDGVRIYFWSNGRKHWQAKFKNGLFNGLIEDWRLNPRAFYFINFKKDNTQGIIMEFSIR